MVLLLYYNPCLITLLLLIFTKPFNNYISPIEAIIHINIGAKGEGRKINNFKARIMNLIKINLFSLRIHPLN